MRRTSCRWRYTISTARTAVTGSSHDQSPPPHRISLSSVPDAVPNAFDDDSFMYRTRVGHAVGDHVDEIAQRRVGLVGGGIEAAVGLEQADPPVALAFGGAQEEVTEGILTLQVGRDGGASLSARLAGSLLLWSASHSASRGS